MPGYVSLADSTVDPPVPFNLANPFPMTAGSKYITALSVGAVGQFQPAVSDPYGNLRVQLTATSSSGGDAVPFSSMSFVSSNATNTGAGTVLAMHPYISNGASLDKTRKPNAYSRLASSAAAGSPTVAKASAGDVTQFFGLNTQAATRYLHIYNKATAPTLGTDTPLLSFPIAASAPFSLSIPNGGAYFSTGISYAFTTDIATVPVTGAAAADITSFAMLVA